MIANLFYILLALIGIGFLIFIHELGHYFMARRVGITVKVFAIGFGKSIYEWERKGVKWKIGWLPFGGFVLMEGMEKKGGLEPYEIKDGFLGAKPWNRIKVAAMGPIVNILFAFLAFTFLWAIGGRIKPFAEYTHYIGWVDKESAIYQEEIRPGDEITKINQNPFVNFNSFIYESVFTKPPLRISGNEINYYTGNKVPFTYTFVDDQKLDGVGKAGQIINVLRPAQYLIYNRMPNGAPNPLLPDSPMVSSGLSYGDRIIWVDGEIPFSHQQFVDLINSQKVLLTVEREGKVFLTRIPRLSIGDLRLTKEEKEELDDWRFDAKLEDKTDQLAFIPYVVDSEGVVEAPLSYIDEKSQSVMSFEGDERKLHEIPLQEGDKIRAVQGEKISSASELLKELQEKKVLIIVKKLVEHRPPLWKEADQGFETSFEIGQLQQIAESIGTDSLVTQMGSLRLLKPVVPIPMHELPLNPKQSEKRAEKLEKQKKEIEEISDPKKREDALKWFQRYQNRLMVGVNLQDKAVAYNPSPIVLFGGVFKETYRTFLALLSGYLSPKYLAGPVGIIQVIQQGWSQGVKEAIYVLGLISLNLGILNLIPIPVLDGGHILFAVIESITKKPLKTQTLNLLTYIFSILLIGLIVYFIYNDLARIITRFF